MLVLVAISAMWSLSRHGPRAGERGAEGGEGVNCPITEQTADGHNVGRCWFYLPDGKTCPRHGDVSDEVARFEATGRGTLENVMRNRKGLSLLEPTPPRAGRKEGKG